MTVLTNFIQLYQEYALAFDLPEMKLLCLHVSEHQDENLIRPIWNQIVDESRCSICCVVIK
jgi:nuclear pore complex protein Nup155